MVHRKSIGEREHLKQTGVANSAARHSRTLRSARGLGIQVMTRFKPTDAVSNDGDLLFFAQDYAPVDRAANLVIDEIGEDAARYAAERADFLHRKGDVLGAAAWRRVAPVIEELQRKRQ
jgi:hypothetical protein